MSKMGRPRMNENEKAKWDDQLTCPLCKGTYLRANQTRHKKTKIHQLAEQLTGGKITKKKNEYMDTDSESEEDFKQKNDKTRFIRREDLSKLKKHNKKKALGYIDDDDDDSGSFEEITDQVMINRYILDRYGNVYIDDDQRDELNNILNNPKYPLGKKYLAIDIAVNEWQPLEYKNKTPNRYIREN